MFHDLGNSDWGPNILGLGKVMLCFNLFHFATSCKASDQVPADDSSSYRTTYQTCREFHPYLEGLI